MDTDQISLLFALLAFLAAAIAIGLLLANVFGRVERLASLAELMVPLAFTIALVTTLGSLYYSGIEHFRPCRLCWWQRIFMYPLVPLLGVGLLRRDRNVAVYGTVLATIGLAWSVYHNRIRWFPPETDSCDAESPCSAVWVNTFDFVSIPFMAACGFTAIIALLATYLRLTRTKSTVPPVAQTEALA